MYRDYADPPFHDVIAQAMAEKGTVGTVFGEGVHRFSYDSQPYRFREIVEQHLIERGYLQPDVPMEMLHTFNSVEALTMDASLQSPVAISLYEISDEFLENYYAFLRDVVRKEIFDFDFYFQRQPTFRSSAAGSPGFQHRPVYHTDIALGHPPAEINFWIPLTTCSGNNSLVYADLDDSVEVWNEFGYDFSKFHAALETDDALLRRCEAMSHSFDASYGDGLLFDARCMHVHQKNDTDRTRVSFDFRIIPCDVLDGMEVEFVGTGRRKARFKPGDYYHVDTIDRL